MKKSISYLSLICMVLFVFSSCQMMEETPITEPDITSNDYKVTEENVDEWLEKMGKLNQDIKVETATLEEINAVMVASGFEPYTVEDVKNAQQSRAIWSCNTWRSQGDWNSNGVLSVTDLVLARNYLCSIAGCNGNLITRTGVYYKARNFGRLSYLRSGIGLNVLNNQDINDGRDFILGLITCF